MLAGVRRKAMRICFGANDSWLVTPVVAPERLRGQHQNTTGEEIIRLWTSKRAVEYSYLFLAFQQMGSTLV